MQNLREYGREPFETVVIHGGPGAPGEMAPVALELSSTTTTGILEPFQTAKTIRGQIEELKDIVTKKGNPPMTLIGWSWGAWLSFLFAAQNPALAKKLILIASGPFTEKDAQNIMKTRLNRMSEEERAKVLLLINVLEGSTMAKKDDALLRLGKLISRADAYNPIPYKNQILECRYDIYQSIWDQATKLRSKGLLLEYGKKIQCPVVAIHGDFDPHPAEGIRRPLARTLKDFRFILLERCGHTPWIEISAKQKFYETLKREL
ncbi:MAG: alpha/beta hydrolase [Candidatus Aminicenantes bacterium]|nr:MAG: alpha/beta hydrolase [Candidatus Aminicenantes bacterium]